MEKSESIKNIAAALIRFASSMDKIRKSAANPFFKSKYAPLPEILAAIAEPLQNAGLALSQHPTRDSLITILIHAESGEYLQSEYPLTPAKNNDPQAVGSAITYARRYAIGAILNLNIDEDDDGNAAASASKTKQQTKQQTEHQPNITLMKFKENGEFHPNWIKTTDWVRKGNNPEKLLAAYNISEELMKELRSIFAISQKKSPANNAT